MDSEHLQNVPRDLARGVRRCAQPLRSRPANGALFERRELQGAWRRLQLLCQRTMRRMRDERRVWTGAALFGRHVQAVTASCGS